jgi:hypothetical protein
MTGYYAVDGQVWLELEPKEVEVLATLVDQLAAMVRPAANLERDPFEELVGIDPQASAPEDVAQARLFPDAYREDPEAADEFRRFTERDLREARLRQTEVFKAILSVTGPGPAPIDPEACSASLGVLNDLRLVLGARLGLQADEDNEPGFLPPDDPRQPLFGAYHWLTWLQSQLLGALHPDGF